MLGFPVLRLRGDYLAIVTLAFGEIIRVVILNWTTLTGGPNGIAGIPRPTLFGLTFTAGGGPGSFADFFGIEANITQRVIFLYYVILGLALLTNWVSLRLRRLPLGRAWEALREDEVACRSLGINVTHDEADGVRDGRRVRRTCGCVLRDAAGVHQPGELHLHRERDRAGDRGAWRLGQPARRGAGGGGVDRRTGDFPRPCRIPDADFRHGAGRDDDRAAARAGLRAHAVGGARQGEGGRARTRRPGPR